MNVALLVLNLCVATAAVVLGILVLSRAAALSRTFGNEVRNEFRTAREEARATARELREELAAGIRSMNDSMHQTLENQRNFQQSHYEGMARQIKDVTDSSHVASIALRNVLDERVMSLQTGNDSKLEAIRKEVGDGLKTSGENLSTVLESMASTQHAQLSEMAQQMKSLSVANQTELERVRATFDLRIKEIQEGSDKKLDSVQTSVSESLKRTSDALEKNVAAAKSEQKTQLDAMTQQLAQMSDRNQTSLESIRSSFDVRVKELQEGNEKKLEEMRRTVDEKLHETLEKRFDQSFKLVSDRLETVHKGLGEMQNLATGVGDLKRVLTNVKLRGTWAEVQLGSILTEMLTTDQWGKNVCVKEGASERVEYAVRLPGRSGDPNESMWLPIDSKFPQEDYMRLQAAAEASDQARVQAAQEALLRTVRAGAKTIHDKYISPPATTDFAIMFLATEGLYAEVLREPGFVQELQTTYRVSVAGPTTLAALLTSLRVGFQTLAIEQRASEVWKVLGAVKTEFGKFGTVLDKVQRHLQNASKTIEETGTRTRAMERKLRSVEQLSPAESSGMLALPSVTEAAASEDDDSAPAPDVLTDQLQPA